MKTAVIDIGTNTLLLLIVDEHRKRIVDLCRFGRLGKGLDKSGRLSSESIAKSLDICREYRGVMDAYGVEKSRVVGTQALREAANAAEFVGPAEEILRAKLEVIGGAREAELAYLSVVNGLPELAHQAFVVVDVGGGSTELIVTDGTRVVSGVSVPIGAVRLSERHIKSDPPQAEELRALEADIDDQLRALELPRGMPIVGTAGTATTLAAISLRLVPYDADRVTGVRLTPEDIDALYGRLARATVAERKSMPGMEPQRADVIVGGAAIYARIMRLTEAPVFVTCDRGIRWGLVYETVSG